ncbi:MAG TPA: serine hydrolase domain-containing protein [Pyrinomonadaceae bacterium]|nr:serine hydrolase domain-containing protein [Pyrinomonadaceae bacterium]
MRRIIFCKNLGIRSLISLVLFCSSVVAHNQSVSKSGMDKERLSQVPVRMKDFVEQGVMAGAVTLIARRGEVVSLEAVGYQDLESKKPMRADTIFDIRSVTKPITAIAMMILMEDGKLTLNEPIEKFLPEFRATGNTQDSPNRITILHLLTHTSGMPLNRPLEIEGITVKRDRTLADVVAILAKQEPEFEPGSQFRYYSGGFAVLGRIVEVVSRKPFEQFIKERIFDPLGMKDSFFFVPADKQNRIASMYRLQDGKLNRWAEIEGYIRNAKYPGPEFGMYSTAPDLFALCQMMLNGGTFKGKRVLSPMSVEAMTQNHTLSLRSAITQRPAYQGLGWGLSGDPMADFPLTSTGSFGHNGAFGGIIWIDPKKELIRIFLEHRFGFNNESNVFMAMAGAAVRD